ncbi:MAG: heme o synthase [Longimicrobiales bacterium]
MIAAEVAVAEEVVAEPRAQSQSGTGSGLGAWLRACLELTKPGITRMVVLTTAAGFYLASRGRLDVVMLVHTLFGTALAASGAGALNQWVERGADALMRRTRRRPLPSGRLTSSEALAVAVGLSAFGLAYLLAFVNTATALVVAASVVSYVGVYTPLKRRTWLATVIGAVPGALPVLAGWTGAGAPLDAHAWAIFAVLFLWQMPHFYALAWIYRDDYVQGGFRMLTATDPAGSRTARQIVLFSLALIAASLLPYGLGRATALYVWGAVLLGGAFLALGLALAAERTDRRAWQLFFGSIVYLPALLLLLVLTKVPL